MRKSNNMKPEYAFLIWLNETEAELLINISKQTEFLEHELMTNIHNKSEVNSIKLKNYLEAVKTIAQKIDFDVFIPEQYHETEMNMFKRNILLKAMKEYKDHNNCEDNIQISEVINWYLSKIKK